MEQEVTPSGQTESAPQIESMSDSDLDAILGGLGTETTETKQQEAAPQPEAEEAPAEANTTEEAPKEETQAEDPPVKLQEEATEPEGDPKAEEGERAQREQELLARIEQQERFIQRRSNEIGQLRTELRAANERLKTALKDRFDEDPEAAVEDKLAIKENEAKLKRLDVEEQSLVQRHQAQKLLSRYVKPEEVSVEDMAESLKSDQLPDEFVGAFRADPYGSALPETLVQLAKRARAEKLLKAVVGYAKKLEGEVAQLKKAPQQVMKKVEQAARSSPQLTGNSGSSAANLSTKAPHLMTDEELDAFLKQSPR